ncbi:DUF2946 family protein [Bradyrhizobium canariense]|uniref:DUF2946 family protein n=1 Tax=Bradyrhizobium canariense TaxID=255045 RepID=UPI003D9AFE8F
MSIGQKRAGMGPRLFWRRLVGAAAIYALILQPLLTVVGVQLANASAIDDLSLSQLCQHATDGNPLSPADQPNHSADDHCAFCFAAAFHVLDAPRPVTIRHVSSGISKVRQSAQPLGLSSFSQYSVARPRGPPLSA